MLLFVCSYNRYLISAFSLLLFVFDYAYMAATTPFFSESIFELKCEFDLELEFSTVAETLIAQQCDTIVYPTHYPPRTALPPPLFYSILRTPQAC